MKIQASSAQVLRPLPTKPSNPAPAFSPTAIPVSALPPAFQQARKLHVLNPNAAAPSFDSSKAMDGVRALSKFIASSVGQKTSLTVNGLWLAVDTVSAIQTIRDPEASKAGKFIDGANLGADGLALLSGVLDGIPALDAASTTITVGALIGDKLHTQNYTLSQSEIVAFSSHPNADQYSNLLKLTEVMTGQSS